MFTILAALVVATSAHAESANPYDLIASGVCDSTTPADIVACASAQGEIKGRTEAKAEAAKATPVVAPPVVVAQIAAPAPQPAPAPAPAPPPDPPAPTQSVVFLPPPPPPAEPCSLFFSGLGNASLESLTGFHGEPCWGSHPGYELTLANSPGDYMNETRAKREQLASENDVYVVIVNGMVLKQWLGGQVAMVAINAPSNILRQVGAVRVPVQDMSGQVLFVTEASAILPGMTSRFDAPGFGGNITILRFENIPGTAIYAYKGQRTDLLNGPESIHLPVFGDDGFH